MNDTNNVNQISEKFLPIGTVVLLQEANKRLMVTGYCAVDESDEKDDNVYDYVGIPFPEGNLSSDENILFDHNQIQQVFALGFVDEEVKEFHKQFNELVKADAEGTLSNDEYNVEDEMVGPENQAFPFSK